MQSVLQVLADGTGWIEKTTCVQAERPEGYRVDLREGRLGYSVLCVRKGGLRIEPTADGATYTLGAGDMLYLPKGYRHSTCYTGKENLIYSVNFTVGGTEAAAGDAFLKKNGGELVSGLEKGAAWSDPLFRKHWLYTFLYQIKQESGYIPAKYRRIAEVSDRMREEFQKAVPVASYARQIFLSEDAFRRLFLEYTGMTPVQFRMKLRLDCARDLLLSGEYAVEEAARQAGFENLSYFCRKYKERFGQTAGACRKRDASFTKN